jgi:hypothetical protein
MNADEEFDLSTRATLAKEQIASALGDLATVLDNVWVRRAERALRYAIAELNGTARASVGDTHYPPPGAA